MRLKAAALLAACALIVSAAYAVTSVSRPSTPTSGTDASDLGPAPGRFDADELERLIGAYEDRAHVHADALELGFLARLYLERAKLSGDVDSYVQAEAAARSALRIAPGDDETRSRLAAIRFAQHDFTGANALAREILAQNPGDVGAAAIAADAALEIGDYPEAEAAYGRLAVVAPGAAAVSARLARLAFLRGDTAGATRNAEAAERAARAEGAFGPGLAWYRTLRSQIAFDAGRYPEAAAHAESAVRAQSGYPAALAALARARVALGDIEGAKRSLESAVEKLPQPDLLASLGDLLTITGDPAGAAERYRTVELIAGLAEINRQVYNRSYALFMADHERMPAEAVRLAEQELRVRHDVYGWDVYAWALHSAGRDREARTASDHALALGTADARLWYHAGIISAALGDTERARAELARALTIGPAFDPIHAPRARAALAALSDGGAGR